MTHLRRAMLEELQRRNYATTTIDCYLKAVERFARHFHRSPDQLTHTHLRECQAYLLRARRLEPRTVKLHVSALRFFFVKTLKRPYMLEDIPFPKVPRRLPAILTTEEVARLIDGAKNLTDRTILMVLYSTGMRNAELRHLQVRDIDSRRMLIHIQHGKGGRDRYVPLSATLLETLRVYYRWMRPKTWLFPGTIHNWRADKPITPKTGSRVGTTGGDPATRLVVRTALRGLIAVKSVFARRISSPLTYTKVFVCILSKWRERSPRTPRERTSPRWCWRSEPAPSHWARPVNRRPAVPRTTSSVDAHRVFALNESPPLNKIVSS